jgi:hypothetical protein
LSDLFKHHIKLPPQQQAIQAKCFRSSGAFTEYPKEEIEKSNPGRFEKIVKRHADEFGVEMDDRTLTCDELNHRQSDALSNVVVENYPIHHQSARRGSAEKLSSLEPAAGHIAPRVACFNLLYSLRLEPKYVD